MAGLENIIGNDQVRAYFRHAIDSGKISHCYILTGEAGIGKLTMAKAFAQTLLCESATGKPCMRCHSCQQIQTDNHPDVIYPKHEKPTVIGVEDVRNGIVSDIQIRPYNSEYKIYIVDEAEKLSIQAQNALLKTIEEPPSYGILILLTTNADAFLDTIRSRSIVLTMRPVEMDILEEYLRKEAVEENKISILSKFSQGNIGKAMKLAKSEDFSEMVDQIMALLRNADAMSFSDLLKGIERLEAYKLDIKDCFSFMRLWYRDVLMFKATGDPNLLVFKDDFRYIRKFGSKCSYHGIERVLQAIDVAEHRLDANVNFSLSIELLWMTIRDAGKA